MITYQASATNQNRKAEGEVLGKKNEWAKDENIKEEDVLVNCDTIMGSSPGQMFARKLLQNKQHPVKNEDLGLKQFLVR